MLNEIHIGFDPYATILISYPNFICQQHHFVAISISMMQTYFVNLIRKWYAKISLQFWVFVCRCCTISFLPLLLPFFAIILQILSFFCMILSRSGWRKTTRSFCNRLVELCLSLHLNMGSSVMDADYKMNACALVIWKMATKNVLKGYHLPLENINHLKLVHTISLLIPFIQSR